MGISDRRFRPVLGPDLLETYRPFTIIGDEQLTLSKAEAIDVKIHGGIGGAIEIDHGSERQRHRPRSRKNAARQIRDRLASGLARAQSVSSDTPMT